MTSLKVFVTGANRGLGLEFCRQYLQRGATVFAGCRNPDTAGELSALRERTPDRLRLVALDVAVPASIRAARESVASSTDALDLLINNAGCFAPGESGIGAIDPDKMVHTFRVNAMGPVLMAQHFVGLLERGSTPKIAALTSGAGVLSRREEQPGMQYSYGGTKAALHVFVRKLASDLRPRGIASYGMGPGWVLTDMTSGGDTRPSLEPPESVRGMMATLDRLTLTQTGGFFSYDGTECAWIP